ncbi:MAG: hypothetical protein EA381_17810 [Planctomycetaceae bacterium]|nr:MAG: hypothetical protein EA381_17810 [Planctomycetaceae bacterium]
MFVGWRMRQDLELFATIPAGELKIDVLRGTCNHHSLGEIDTYIAGELAAWFEHRLAVHQISRVDILAATLTVQLERIDSKTNRHRSVTFDWHCVGLVSTADREYRSHLCETHAWVPAA